MMQVIEVLWLLSSQYCCHMHCLQYGAQKEDFSNPLSVLCLELGEQLCHQERSMSCTPPYTSSPHLWTYLRCSVLGGERESEQIFFLCLDQEVDVWWEFVHLIPTWLLAASFQFLKGKHCAVNLIKPFKEAERKQSGHSRVGKTENCCLVISSTKCCTWSYSVRLLGPELGQMGKVISLTL